jgi:hypothetical protein
VPTPQVFVAYLIHDVIGENDFLALLHFLRIVLIADVLHAAWVASAQVCFVFIPRSIILVLNAERLDFKANNSRQVSLNVTVIQDGEPQMVVQRQLAIILHATDALLLQLRKTAQSQLNAEGGLHTSMRPIGNPLSYLFTFEPLSSLI